MRSTRCFGIALACVLGVVSAARAGDPPLRVPSKPGVSDHSSALASLGLSDGETLALALPADVGDGLLVDVRLDGVPHTLRLVPHSVRAAGFQLIEVGADGVRRSIVPPPPTTVRGEVLGLPGSLVAGSLVDGDLTVHVTFADRRSGWVIEPLPDSPYHVVYDETAIAPGFEPACSTEIVTGSADAGHAPGPASLAGTSTFPLMAAQLAIDIDVETYQQLGSVVAAEDHVESILNGVSAIYETFVGVRIDISVIVVRTAEPDPYTKGDPSLLLDEIRAEWLDPPPGVEFDFVQLFRGKNIVGVAGVADGGGRVCGDYLFSCAVETFAYAGFKRRVRLSAHELGHLFSAPHCQGQAGCGIMCPAVCGPVDSFGPNSVEAILLTKFSRDCLDFIDTPLPPLVVDVTPTTTQSFIPEFIHVTGQGFTMTSAVEVDGVPMDSFFFKVFADDELHFRPPVPDVLGPLDVRIVAPGGQTALFQVEVTGNNPPVLAVNSVVLEGQPMSWSWGGPEGHKAALLLSLSPDTVSPSGYEQLADVLRWVIQPLDAHGLGGTSITSVPAAAAGLEFHSQILTFDGHGHSAVSPVKSTSVIGFP